MALIVIDMQPSFGKCVDDALPGVITLIEKARRRHEAIFLVTFGGEGKTHPSVVKALRKYDLKFSVTKYGWDGSHVIMLSMKAARRSGKIRRFSKIKFCGVLTNDCVRDTLTSMAKLGLYGPRHNVITRQTIMELVLPACAPDLRNEFKQENILVTR